MVVWVAGNLFASRLSDAAEPGLRVLAVVIGVCSALPWARIAIGGIREADEFSRELHLVGLAIAFGGVALSLLLIDWLQRAGFMGPLHLSGIGLFGAWLWWGIGLISAKRIYR